MKKVLFIMNDLECGGAQKALISLLENFDYSKYEVDLLLLNQEGIFMNSLPKEVNLLSEPKYYKYFNMSLKKAAKELIKLNKYNILFSRLVSIMKFKYEKNSAVLEQKFWKNFSVSLENINKKYYAAIGFLEKTPIYYCVDKVKANKKIGWIHTNYEAMGMDWKLDKPYFEKLDKIVTVSENSSNILKNIFKDEENKIKVIKNIISSNTIYRLSRKEVEFDDAYINIVTVGRLTAAKGYDLAIDACRNLVNKGYKVKWYVIGEGEERKALEKKICEKNLENYFILLGLKDNPYPYIYRSDIYCQTSLFEGIGISITEAKILKKPIVITNFESAQEQIKNNFNGIICEMCAEKISDSIIKLIEDEDLRKKFINNLKQENISNEYEVDNLYKIID